jgi:hypothetical protein
MEAMRDRQLARVIHDCARDAFLEGGNRLQRVGWFLKGLLDPNDWRLVRENAVGVRCLPLSTDGHSRRGTRERVLDVARRYPERLGIVMNALATKVILDADQRAMGVEFLQGERLYRAHTPPSGQSGERRALYASREVILAGRRVQLAADPHAVRHRAPGDAPASWDRSTRAFAGRGHEPPGSLRGRDRVPDEHEGLGGLQGRNLWCRRSAVR